MSLRKYFSAKNPKYKRSINMLDHVSIRYRDFIFNVKDTNL